MKKRTREEIVRDAYLIMVFEWDEVGIEADVEIFDRNYRMISIDESIVVLIRESKLNVDHWTDYQSPYSAREGDAVWYIDEEEAKRRKVQGY
tara:strand:+ start:640 stop:915 length:276 start_codon:yes stop_codon:yes gene_type:complete